MKRLVLSIALISAVTAVSCGKEEVAAPDTAVRDNVPAPVGPSSKYSKEALETVDNLMIVGNALYAYRAENWQKEPEATSFAELRQALAPGYIGSLPANDGWGEPIKLVAEHNRGPRYMIASGGADKSFQMTDAEIVSVTTPELGEKNDLSRDFIASGNGVFIYPVLGTIAVGDNPPAPLKVVRLTVLRFGKRGEYAAVQGAVGNGSKNDFPSIQNVAKLFCKENPAAQLSVHKPEKILEPERRITYLKPGSVHPFRHLVELDLASLPSPCTLDGATTFEHLGGASIPHEVTGDARVLTNDLAAPSSTSARDGEVVSYVNKVKRLIYNDLVEVSGREYELETAPMATDLVPVPSEAMAYQIRHHFQRFVSSDDWSPQDVDAASKKASEMIREYMQVIEPGPESAQWSEFRKRNFAGAKRIAQKKLMKDAAE